MKIKGLFIQYIKKSTGIKKIVPVGGVESLYFTLGLLHRKEDNIGIQPYFEYKGEKHILDFDVTEERYFSEKYLEQQITTIIAVNV